MEIKRCYGCGVVKVGGCYSRMVPEELMSRGLWKDVSHCYLSEECFLDAYGEQCRYRMPKGLLKKCPKPNL